MPVSLDLKSAIQTDRLQNKIETIQDSQLNVYNFKTKIDGALANYVALRFDPNNTCNLHCVYCHNHRSDEVIEQELFDQFLHTKVGTITDFQFGCIMEPTLDKRMADFMLQIARSPARPTRNFILQTNGILLHRHDHEKFREAGLTLLSVSMDAADSTTQKELRNGTSLAKVLRNVKSFIEACPETKPEFITTVTRSNIQKIEDLVALGLDIGISGFTFREIFYYPENDVVDHTRMPGLLLREGEFKEMTERVLGRFDGKADFCFVDNNSLHASAKRMIRDSEFAGREIDDRYADAPTNTFRAGKASVKMTGQTQSSDPDPQSRSASYLSQLLSAIRNPLRAPPGAALDVNSAPEIWADFNVTPEIERLARKRRVARFPPPPLMQRTSGLTSEQDFASHGRDLSSYESVLDFGVGSGRLARMFMGFKGRYTGLDIDHELVRWAAKSLPWVTPVYTHPKEPLPFQDALFDLVISISVFTHMNEEDSDFYLRDLQRVTKHGATLLLTVHGERVLKRAETEEAILNMLAIDHGSIEKARHGFPLPGFVFVRQNGHLTNDKYEYGVSFISENYIWSKWKKLFDVKKIHRGLIHDFQDVVVLTR
jgi:molybdenum cofactor biosynthesis enzyme MoaA/SAM-dependent methyltransferase